MRDDVGVWHACPHTDLHAPAYDDPAADWETDGHDATCGPVDEITV